jgi:ATP-dependent DNA helicase RecG
MPGFELEDCDSDELALSRSRIEEVGRFGAKLPSSHSEMLERLYLCRNGRLTNAAAVLFAARPRMWSPEIFIRIVSYSKDKSGPLANDVIVEGPAVRTIYDAISIIQQRTGFSGRFHKDRLEREDRPAYAVFALRESMVNAVAHRAYNTLGGSIRVEIYPDRLVISNPGSLPEGWTTGNLRKEHKSIPFNPDISSVLYYQKLMDQLGVGTQRMIEECKRVGAKLPVWSAQAGMVSVTLFKAPEPVAKEELSGRLGEFVQTLDGSKEVKTADYMSAAGVSERQARRDLAELEERGVIERVGKGRATAYRKRPKGAV